MKNLKILSLGIIILIAAGCNKGGGKNGPPDGLISISDLTTRTDYRLPFALANDSNIISMAVLNGDTVDFTEGEFLEFTANGFYELILTYNDQPADTFLFTTTTAEREDSEWGIRAWTPVAPETKTLGSETIEAFYPRRYADSINLPFIFYTKEAGLVKTVYCEGLCTTTASSFNIKRGAGSVAVQAGKIKGGVSFLIGGRHFDASPSKITGNAIELKGTIASPTHIPANSLVKITSDINITSTGSLTVAEGVVMLIREGADIILGGPVTFSGTASNPVLVTCSRSGNYWGGFISDQGGVINATYTIFSQSGYNNGDGYDYGHAGRQALFYSENSTLILGHCFITDHIGQIFYPVNSSLDLDNILVQRAFTGGQINYSNLILQNSVFTDFPDDSSDFADNDNDALYLSASDARISNTVFMYAKDDGLDSGNEEGGEITLTGCVFEACFHEGAALSSAGEVIKNHTFTGCTFTNCGQGLELGFSSPNHTVIADNCYFLNNGVGIRYGDNYDWSEVEGRMIIRNSFSLNNDRDVWNMIRMTWRPRLENMTFENTFVSRVCPQYPDLKIQSATP
ncbi:MAG: right-handed parallel beta-helix repeat-containing protein [Bacteroidales bacterium]